MPSTVNEVGGEIAGSARDLDLLVVQEQAASGRRYPVQPATFATDDWLIAVGGQLSIRCQTVLRAGVTCRSADLGPVRPDLDAAPAPAAGPA